MAAAAATVRRWVGRSARAAAWGAKGVLAAVAMGVVIAWAWSHARPGAVERWRWEAVAAGDNTPRFVVREASSVAWRRGFVAVGASRTAARPHRNSYKLRQWQAAEAAAVADGPGWHRRWTWAGGGPGVDFPTEAGLLPCWRTSTWWGDGRPSTRQGVETTYVRLWAVAAAAGAWPALSLAGWWRRRRRAARAARIGHCRRCGYDLRATPAADGPRLATCPECGGGEGEG